jgi:hypothetical protein
VLLELDENPQGKGQRLVKTQEIEYIFGVFPSNQALPFSFVTLTTKVTNFGKFAT